MSNPILSGKSTIGKAAKKIKAEHAEDAAKLSTPIPSSQLSQTKTTSTKKETPIPPPSSIALSSAETPKMKAEKGSKKKKDQDTSGTPHYLRSEVKWGITYSRGIPEVRQLVGKAGCVMTCTLVQSL